MKAQQLRYLIREELQKIIKEEAPTTTQTNTPSDVKNLNKAQSSSSILKSKASEIDKTNELPGAFEDWFKTLGYQPTDGKDPEKHKISKQTIIPIITKSLNKLGYK